MLQSLLQQRRSYSPSSFLDFPLVSPSEHTMGESLRGYVAQRIPEEAVQRALSLGFRIEVHGVSSELLEANQEQLGISSRLQEIDLAYNRWQRAKCSRRPIFYLAEEQKKIVVSVISGNDYLRHYAALLRHYVHHETEANPEETVTIIEYPALQNALCEWTSFDQAIQEGDLVCYGYAADLLAYMQREGGPSSLQALGVFENDYYYAARYLLHGKLTVNFYECKHHGWGDISARTMRRAAQLGASEIIYLSKGATCESPAQIYEKIYCPTRYAFARYQTLVAQTTSLPNGLLKTFPELETGLHVSPPCVMEEDFTLRALASSLGASSLDNEAAQIALQLEEHNQETTQEVHFTAIQFATDYLRRREDHHLQIEFDLENNRKEKAEARRKEIQRRIFEVIERYLIKKANADHP